MYIFIEYYTLENFVRLGRSVAQLVLSNEFSIYVLIPSDKKVF